MSYCPKCQQNYDDGAQRFCSNDGARLLSAPSSGKFANQSDGVFTHLLGKIDSGIESREKISPTPEFANAGTFDSIQPKTFPGSVENTFAAEPANNFESKPDDSPQKPLPRIIRSDEISVGQAKLGDRKINLTRENTDILLNQTVKGRYQIIEILSVDEMSVAYLAKDKIVPDKKVVVRILMDEDNTEDFAGKIFAEERVSLSLVDHPNISRILDSGEMFEGKPFIISEFAEGESVREMLKKTGECNALRTARIISQTANALSEAHRNGVLHRNLKPENIILTISPTGSEQVKLTNFGIFKDDLNRENAVYKSPEQIEGKPANFASDIYSLAVIAFQMLTNRLPFGDGLPVKDLLKAQREGLILHPTNLRLDVPRSIDKILEKALNFNPSERYPKAHDFGDSFSNSLTTGAASADQEEIDEIELITEEDVDNAIENSTLSQPSAEPVSLIGKVPPPILSPVSEQKIEPVNVETLPKENDELPWEKRSSEPSKTAGWNFVLISVLGILLLTAGVWGFWTYFLNPSPEPQIIETPTESVFPTPEENINASAPTPADIEIPPLPRTVSQPPNTEYFQNSKENLKGDLAKNFLGFSLYYPKDWRQNAAEGKFLDISKNSSNGTMVEQMLVGYYDSKGTYTADAESFPALVEETNTTLKEIVPNYEVVSVGEKTVNNGWRAYEVKFKGSGTRSGKEITLWGKRFFIPPARPGMKNGYVLTMLATSLSPDVESVDDVGVKGELSTILESFEPNQNF